jgi:hypothetical protein
LGVDAANWDDLAGYVNRGAWAPNTDYAERDMVQQGGSWRMTDVAHRSGATFAPDAANWNVINGQGPWQDATHYAMYDAVSDGGVDYICLTDHTSGAFDHDETAGHWVQVLADKGDYAGATAYAVGDGVSQSGNVYVCQTAHTSGGPADDETAGNLLRTNSERKSWSDVEKRDWVTALNDELNAMLEGADGKFWVKGPDDHDFKKVYVRMMAQWEVVDPGTAATAGTHYELEVPFDDGTWFETANYDLKAGSGINKKTLIRYIFGKLSNTKATRDTQDLTSDLAKAHLTALSAWVAAQVGGGAFSVEDI